MKATIWLTLIFTLALTAPAGSTDKPEKCKRNCLTVSPKEGDLGQVFFVRGHNWRSNRPITATFPPYCPPGGICTANLKAKTFKPSKKGSFVFHFELGPGSCNLEGVGTPGGVGKGPLVFRQGLTVRTAL